MAADFDKDDKIDFTSCNFSNATNIAVWRNNQLLEYRVLFEIFQSLC
jgi:hypothetical protein